jgi:tetratricopeptide (TPR) repeat protein
MEGPRKLAINLAVILIIFFGGYAVISAAMTSTIEFQPIDVPKELTDRGQTGEILAQRLRDEINELYHDARTTKVSNTPASYRAPLFRENASDADRSPVGSDNSIISAITTGRTKPQFDVSYGGVSLAAAIYYLHLFIGPPDTFIKGEVTVGEKPPINLGGNFNKQAPKFLMRVRIANKGTIYTLDKPADNLDVPLKSAALRVLEQIDPYIAASYYDRKAEYQEARRMIQVCLSNNNPDDTKWALNLSALITNKLKQKLEKDALADDSEKQLHRNETIAEFKSLTEKYPDFPPPYYNLAEAYIADSQYSMALKNALVGIGYDRNKHSRAIGYYKAGKSLRFMKQDDEAIENFRLAVEDNPTFSGAFTEWGSIMRSRRDNRQARALYEKAIAANPKEPSAYNLLGIMDWEGGDQDKAIIQFQNAIDADPNWPQPHYNLGRVLSIAGQFQKANTAFKKATELDKTHALAFAFWGRNLAIMARQQRGKIAAAIFKESISVLDSASRLSESDEVRVVVNQARELLNPKNAIIHR